MCDSERDSRSMISLRMKSPSSLFNSTIHNETNSPSQGSLSSSTAASLNYHSASNCQIGPAAASTVISNHATQLAEYNRIQIYDYATQSMRYRLGHPAFASSGHYGLAAAAAAAAAAYTHPAFSDGASLAVMSPFARFDPRFRFMHEEPKPQHSYIGLIAMAILSLPDQKMVLSDIYQHILDHYPYFRNRGPGWRNSIRHNLSLNDCFVKAGRSANGKGHYWAIHPANVDDFKKGDFRRRKAQRKVRKHMGLAVPDDDDSPDPTPPPPLSQSNLANAASAFVSSGILGSANVHAPRFAGNAPLLHDIRLTIPTRKFGTFDNTEIANMGSNLQERGAFGKGFSSIVRANKRQFDVESLLAPDCDSTVDDNGSVQIVSPDKTNISLGECDAAISQADDNQSNSPSISSLNDFVVTKADSIGSDSSSPSISSTAEKIKINTQPIVPFFPNSSIVFPPSSWQNAQLKSFQTLQHQMNAGLINQSLFSGGSNNLHPWTLSAAALSNAQVAAATLLGYATVTNQNFDIQSQEEKH